MKSKLGTVAENLKKCLKKLNSITLGINSKMVAYAENRK